MWVPSSRYLNTYMQIFWNLHWNKSFPSISDTGFSAYINRKSSSNTQASYFFLRTHYVQGTDLNTASPLSLTLTTLQSSYISLAPFCRWGDGGARKWGNLPKATLMVSDTVGMSSGLSLPPKSTSLTIHLSVYPFHIYRNSPGRLQILGVLVTPSTSHTSA